jgi:hypothetical protein
MLFDLRGRGRRRTVKVVYMGLVALFLLGFLGLGIGVGGGGGGILNFFTEEKSTGGASFAAKVESAQARTHSHPSDPAAWAALAEAQLHQASEPEYVSVVNEREEGFNAKGLALLAQVSKSWNTYLHLQPHRANAELAYKIAGIYGERTLNNPVEEARTLQVAIAGKSPSGALYAALAEAAYKARHIGEGDAALKKALPLIPAEERKKQKKYLLEIRKNPLAHVPISLHKAANGTYVATQAGKTATVAPGKKPGTFTGIGNAKTATPPPAGHTTSTAKK